MTAITSILTDHQLREHAIHQGKEPTTNCGSLIRVRDWPMTSLKMCMHKHIPHIHNTHNTHALHTCTNNYAASKMMNANSICIPCYAWHKRHIATRDCSCYGPSVTIQQLIWQISPLPTNVCCKSSYSTQCNFTCNRQGTPPPSSGSGVAISTLKVNREERI